MDLTKMFNEFLEKEHMAGHTLSSMELRGIGRFIRFVEEKDKPLTLKIHVSDSIGAGDTVR